MTGGSLGLRTGSYASLHLQLQNGALQNSATSPLVHKASKTNLSSTRERERVIPLCCRYFGRRRVAMLLLFILALLVFVFGSFAVSRDSSDLKAPYEETTLRDLLNPAVLKTEEFKDIITSTHGNLINPPFPYSNRSLISYSFPRHSLPSPHPCINFSLPPPAPANGKRTGARPCPVCYIPVEQAIASMPIAPSISPVLRNLTYIHDGNPIKTEPHGGSDFGGYPSLRQRNDSSQLFFQIIGDLAMDPENALCGKKKDAALELKRQGNQCFLNGDYTNALVYYSKALQVAPMNAVDMDKNLVATLYVNRASVLHKMDLQLECLRDCNRALQISSTYAKAWYRRGKANVSMDIFDDAIRDFKISKHVEVSFNGKKLIDDELKVVQHQHSRSNTANEHSKNKLDDFDDPIQVKLHVTTSIKGRGMVSPTEIPPSSLVHVEEPYAVVILKHCRETHCHYCLNELPVDKVPCPSCSIPLYCSQHCQIQAGGRMLQNVPDVQDIFKNLSDDLRKYVQEITLCSFSELRTEDVPEHKHECDGVHWPAILPSEIVLAGRIVAKFIAQRGVFTDASNIVDMLNLSHHFPEMHADSKLECIIYSIMLLSCLQQFFPSKIAINGNTTSQIAILISQIRTNSISIVRMKSFDAPGSPDKDESLSSVVPFTCNMEQVRVGQAIYTTGSLFNHSCKPNIHAYFNSRTLFIRATVFMAVGCPLELSYGPQVGQLDCKDRLQLLKDEYSFNCQCSGCSTVHISDLVINAFCCINPNCRGVVLDRSIFSCENTKTKDFLTVNDQMILEPFMQTDSFLHAGPSHCLKCGSYCDIKSSRLTVDKAGIHFTRLQQEINLNRVSETTVSDALGALISLKSTLHEYNRRIAEAEDNLSQAFSLLGKLELAAEHCKASIRILEKLYGENHIAIGNELSKLSSILISVGDHNAVDCIKRLSKIFRCYYGSNVNTMFPFLNILEEETHKFVSTHL